MIVVVFNLKDRVGVSYPLTSLAVICPGNGQKIRIFWEKVAVASSGSGSDLACPESSGNGSATTFPQK